MRVKNEVRERIVKIKILADSTCDLSEELIEKYGIIIVPLSIEMDGRSYKDGLEITPEEIYRWSDSSGKTPKTAAVGLDTAIEAMKPLDEEGMEIITFGISEEMSSTCNVFRLAGEEMKHAKVHVIDSANLSTGIGLQVLRAAELAADGKAADQIVSEIMQARSKVRASFVVDTLVYLQRGGRCSAVTALLAGALKLKPQISVVDGKMDVAKKYRGSIRAVTKKYVKDQEEDLIRADKSRVFITHSGCPEDVVEEVRAYLLSLNHFDEILVTKAGSVISSHCGPNTLGVLFYEG